MKIRLIVILSLLLIIPLVLIFIFGSRIIGEEQQYANEKFQDVFRSRLSDIELGLRNLMAGYERQFLGMEHLSFQDTEAVRRFIRKERLVRQIFILAPDGQLLHPPAVESRTRNEQDFFTRTEFIWRDGESFYKPRGDGRSGQAKTSGWYTWFWGKGLNLIYWMLGAGDRIVGIEVDSTALAADIIAGLPGAEEAAPDLETGRIILSGIGDKVIYQWGRYQSPEKELPFVRIPVSSPLDGWHLSYYLAVKEQKRILSNTPRINLAAGGIVLFAVLFSLAVYFFRENSRAIREAGRKVSFVNQVSHELKTPLTNIRLYAELLEQKLRPAEEKGEHYLQVIVSESRRLSRLILNVLTFARDGREKLVLRRTPGVVDEVILEVIENFRHPFTVCGIIVQFTADAGQTVSFDHDCLCQILGNLFSNVEKYAAGGREMQIKSRYENGNTIITVRDRGPGISGADREKIFRPFVRLSNKLNEGVSGTGLGLTIARRLAQLHGGNVKLLPAAAGAGFMVTLETAPVPGGPEEVRHDHTDCRG